MSFFFSKKRHLADDDQSNREQKHLRYDRINNNNLMDTNLSSVPPLSLPSDPSLSSYHFTSPSSYAISSSSPYLSSPSPYLSSPSPYLSSQPSYPVPSYSVLNYV